MERIGVEKGKATQIWDTIGAELAYHSADGRLDVGKRIVKALQEMDEEFAKLERSRDRVLGEVRHLMEVIDNRNELVEQLRKERDEARSHLGMFESMAVEAQKDLSRVEVQRELMRDTLADIRGICHAIKGAGPIETRLALDEIIDTIYSTIEEK